MNLDALILKVRPRTAWETMDLSVKLAVSLWKPLLLSNLFILLPIVFFIALLLLEAHPYWSFFLIWWLKPLYDRFYLLVFSRSIFGDQVNWNMFYESFTQLIKTSLFSSLIWYRLDPARAFVLPVIQLEKLTAHKKRQRLKVLTRSARNREFLLLILCFHIESLLFWGIVGFGFLLVPMEISEKSFSVLFDSQEPNYIVNLFSLLLYAFIIMLVEPLYVSGGFMLYLNRRIILEGWDLELAFRNLAHKHPSPKNNLTDKYKKTPLLMTAMMLILVASLIVPDDELMANEANVSHELTGQVAYPPKTTQESSEVIHEVMQMDVFNRMKEVEELEYLGDVIHSEQRHEDRETWSDFFEFSGQLLAKLFEIALWIVALFLIIWIYRHRHQFMSRLMRRHQQHDEVPEQLFGLKVSEQSIPDNVPEEVLALYQQEHYRESMALLYRATLSKLVEQYQFRLTDGATEGDCMIWVDRHHQFSNDFKVFFKELTQFWQYTAYAHRYVTLDILKRLCHQWQSFYLSKETHDLTINGINDV